MRSRTGLGSLLAAVAICWLVTAIGAQAATRTWNGAGTNALASNPTNWVGGIAPAAADDIVLDATTNKNMTWDAAAPSNVASWYQVGYAGTVTIATVYGSTGFTNFTIAGDCVISNGTWTHADNAATEAYRLNMFIGGDLTVAAGGTINVDGRGYDFKQGPGKGSGDSGGGSAAGYGGEGGSYGSWGRGQSYGSIIAPTNLGSGGAAPLAGYGSGGGAAILTVVGNTTVNGTISAVGQGSAGYFGGGAGGSVFLTTSNLTGSGVINASGGLGQDGSNNNAGGGGGRIAIVLTSGTDFGNVLFQAPGGSASGSMEKGAAGTIYLKKSTDTYGTLLVDNNAQVTPAMTLLTNGAFQFDMVITTNYGVLHLGSNALLNLALGGQLSSDSLSTSITSRIIFSAGDFLFPAAFTLTNATISQMGLNAHSWTTTLTVANGGVLTHEKNSATETNKLNLTINGDLTVAAGGTINVDGRGYAFKQGPGKGSGDSGGGSAAGYGGEGGLYGSWGRGQTYGSIIAPTNLGSGGAAASLAGGYGSGGGAAILTVVGNTTVNGTISALGQGSAGFYGGGAGGSVFLTTSNLTGSGVINASGGLGQEGSGNNAGGGGGRIAIVLTSGTDFGNVLFQAPGGSASGSMEKGAAGTVYRQTAGQGTGRGTLMIDNSQTTAARTQVPPFTNAIPDEIVNAMVMVTNLAAVVSTTNATVGELLIYTNCFWTLTNWTVSVNKLEHSLEDATKRGPGATNRVDHYDQILWIGRPPGTVFVVY